MGGNPILLFIAVFVWLAASSESHAVQMREVARGMITDDAMITRFERLGPASRVEDAVQCLIRTTQHEFPVVDDSGRLIGLLTRDELIRALREHGPETPVTEVMRRDIPTLRHRRGLDEALRLMQQGRLPAVGVTDAADRLIGFVTPENIGEMMMVEAARPARGRPSLWKPVPSRPAG